MTTAASDWVYGLHSVRALLAASPSRVGRVLVDRARHDRRFAELESAARAAGVRLERIEAASLERLAPGVVHQGVLAEVHIPQPMDEHALVLHLQQCAHAPLVLVLDGIQDPRNLGACLRSAEAAGVDAVVMPMRRAAPLTAAAIKTASGAAVSLRIAQVVNLARVLRALREQGFRIIGAAGEGTCAPWETDLSGPLALVMGGEAQGLRHLTRELCDELVRLPMAGVVESLNVSVATGVCLYEALRQRGSGSRGA